MCAWGARRVICAAFARMLRRLVFVGGRGVVHHADDGDAQVHLQPVNDGESDASQNCQHVAGWQKACWFETKATPPRLSLCDVSFEKQKRRGRSLPLESSHDRKHFVRKVTVVVLAKDVTRVCFKNIYIIAIEIKIFGIYSGQAECAPEYFWSLNRPTHLLRILLTYVLQAAFDFSDLRRLINQRFKCKISALDLRKTTPPLAGTSPIVYIFHWN